MKRPFIMDHLAAKWALVAATIWVGAWLPTTQAGDLGVDVNADVDAFGKNQMDINGLASYSRQHTVQALPLFNQPPDDHVRYWDNMVEQYQSAGIDFVAVWLKGNGQPATFANFVTAVEKRRLGDRIKIMPFDDNPASWTALWNSDHGHGYNYKVPFDVGETANWTYVWDKNLKVFFEHVPDANRYKIDGRPVYRVWSAAPAFLTNVAGNGSKLLRYLREQCRRTFGFNPYIMVPEEWIKLDPSSDDPAVVDAVAPWFTPVPGPNYSDWNVHTWHGVTVGACIPQFRISNDADPNAPTWIVDPEHAQTLAKGLANTAGNARCLATFIEGFDDYWENATLWRARNIDPGGLPLGYKETGYDYPNQRLNVVRRYSRHPFPPDLREEAENCDTFSGAAPRAAAPNDYRNGELAIEETSDAQGGYNVCYAQAGETLTWREVPMEGTVHLQVRVATLATDARMHFVMDGIAQKAFAVPTTGGAQEWATVEAGEWTFARGSNHTVALVIDTAGINVNWWQLRP